jgi:hypothetical protein
MRSRIWLRHWIILFVLALLAGLLFALSVVFPQPIRMHELMQAVAEALIVAIIVAVVVEPRLLRHFGEQISSNTFWTSFYSRAPERYREAVKELAAAEQFNVAADWHVCLEWANTQKSVIKLTIDFIQHRLNRSPKQQTPGIKTFIYESSVDSFAAEFIAAALICQSTASYIDLMTSGYVETTRALDGRLLLDPSKSFSGSVQIPPGEGYTFIVTARTYARATGYLPLVVVIPALEFKIRFSGNALDDLYLSISSPAATPSLKAEGYGCQLKDMGEIKVGDVFVTGQTVLLAWKRTQVNEIDGSADIAG